jgi:hypothetical protein
MQLILLECSIFVMGHTLYLFKDLLGHGFSIEAECVGGGIMRTISTCMTAMSGGTTIFSVPSDGGRTLHWQKKKKTLESRCSKLQLHEGLPTPSIPFFRVPVSPIQCPHFNSRHPERPQVRLLLQLNQCKDKSLPLIFRISALRPKE